MAVGCPGAIRKVLPTFNSTATPRARSGLPAGWRRTPLGSSALRRCACDACAPGTDRNRAHPRSIDRSAPTAATDGAGAQRIALRYRKFKRPFRAVCRVGVGRTRASLGAAWVRIRTSARRFRLCAGAQRGSAWSFLIDSRQWAERSPAARGRIVSSSRFRPRPFDCAQDRLCGRRAHAAAAGGARAGGR